MAKDGQSVRTFSMFFYKGMHKKIHHVEILSALLNQPCYEHVNLVKLDQTSDDVSKNFVHAIVALFNRLNRLFYKKPISFLLKSS